MRWRAFYPGVTLAVLLAVPLSVAGQGSVDLITVQGVIDPIVARLATRAIASATDHHAEAVIIQMDTPGGLDVSMRQIVQAIIGSPVPVIVYVAPPGARAGSAGVFITMAAHVAAMAPGTNIGAAHPVSIGGAQIPKTQEEKILNDAAAYIKTLAARRGRNAAWAEEAVRQSVSVTEEEALKLRVIDLVAKDVNDLLTQIDGRNVSTARGEKILSTRAAKLRERSMSLPERFLHAIVDPNVAYFLLILGFWALIAEFSHPGAILPGVTGVICLILAFVAFGSLPANWAGVALIIFGLILFVLDIKVTSFALGVGGAIAFILGSLRGWARSRACQGGVHEDRQTAARIRRARAPAEDRAPAGSRTCDRASACRARARVAGVSIRASGDMALALVNAWEGDKCLVEQSRPPTSPLQQR